ncbi:MAG: hypothetical protein ACF788_01940, partial [Novipirellula sp. JB048]
MLSDHHGAVAQESTATSEGQNVKGLPPSLRFVPHDASVYFAQLNNRAKWDAVVGSDAVQSFLATPTGQKMKNEFIQEIVAGLRHRDPSELSPWSRDALAFVLSDSGRALLPLLTNLASQELFIFADGSLDELLMQFDQKVQTGLATGAEVASHVEPLSIPKIVAGARLSDASDRQQAIALLTLLESAIRNNVLGLSDSEHEYINQALRRETQGSDHDVWIFRFDYRDYPWDAAIARLKNDPGSDDPAAAIQQMESLRDHPPTEPLIFTVGIQHGYLLTTIASEQYHRSDLLAAEPLYKTTIFEPLLANRHRTFSAVSYRSSDYQQLTSWVNSYAPILPMVASGIRSNLAEQGIDPEVAARLSDDLDADLAKLTQDLRNAFAPAADRLNFSYLYNGGIAGYRYDSHRDPLTFEPQPLEILKHVGPNPLYFRASADWDSQDGLQSWMQRIETRAQQFSAALGPGDLPANGRNPGLDLLTSIFSTTKDQFLPSLGNQSAWVVDLSMRSQSWHSAVPPSQAELPFPALALVYQLRDAAQHRQAWRQYYQSVAPLTATVAPLAGFPPGSMLPAATETKIPGGVFLHLAGTSALGADRRFSPGLALSDQWAVYGLFPAQANRLLRPSSPQLPPPLNDLERPLIGATYFDFQQLGQAIQLWVDYSQPMIESALRQ